MHNLSALEGALRDHALDDDDQPGLAWDLHANSVCVRVNAATQTVHGEADRALADAKILLQEVEDAGFKMRLGSVSASITEGGGWRGRLVEVVLDPVD
jgi:hypothetical protein